MATFRARVDARSLSILSLILGLLGLGFCWWVPLGVVIGMAGLIVGLVNLIQNSGATRYRTLAIGVTLFCLAVVVFDLVLGANGWDLITFSALR